MESHTDTGIVRRRRRAAAEYRKQGYRVAYPPGPDTLPPFLSDCHPELIAERDDDRVIVEVRRAKALKGANDLVMLAERVAAQPGWRLELIALRSDDHEPLPPGWLDRMLRTAPDSVDHVGNLSYLTDILSVLMQDVARQHRIRTKGKTALRLADELAIRGIIHPDLESGIRQCIKARDLLLRELPASLDAAMIEKLCRDLQAKSQTPQGLTE